MGVQASSKAARQRAAWRRRSGPLSYLAIAAFLVGAALVNARWPVSTWYVAGYLAASALCFIVYGFDKSRAKSGGRRVPEKTLHLLEFFGGWPGALVAQQVLRHKTQKTSFRIAFWVCVLANVMVFAVLTTPLWRTVLGA